MPQLHEILIAPVMKKASEHLIQCSTEVIEHAKTVRGILEALMERAQKGEQVDISELEALLESGKKMVQAGNDSREAAQMMNTEGMEIIREVFGKDAASDDSTLNISVDES